MLKKVLWYSTYFLIEFVYFRWIKNGMSTAKIKELYEQEHGNKNSSQEEG